MANIEVRDVDIDPETMPLCPLCDQPLFAGEGFFAGRLRHPMGTTFCLVHQDCVDDDEDGEE